MPHIVQPHAPQPGLLPDGCKVPVEVTRVERRADLGSEDEAIFINPKPLCASQLLALLVTVGEQSTAGDLREGNGGVGCLRLGVIEEQPAIDSLESLTNVESGVLEVDILPAEAEQLPAT